jgi:hypothetical protein
MTMMMAMLMTVIKKDISIYIYATVSMTKTNICQYSKKNREEKFKKRWHER